MSYQDFEKMFKNFKGELYLYISGSQGVSSAGMVIKYGVDFTDLESLMRVFDEFIDEHTMDYVEDYLDNEYNEDGDPTEEELDDAHMEAISNAGDFLIGVTEEDAQYIYELGEILPYEN